MTEIDTGLAHYVGILEAVVAVLAIKHGLNPETMMGRAIEDITEQAGMETLDTERIIRERWSGRDLPAGKLAAQMLPESFSPVHSAQLQEPPTASPIAERLASYKERLNQAVALKEAGQLQETVETEQDSEPISE